MLLLSLHAALGSIHGVEVCLEGTDHSALMFCQELAPEHQLELAVRYRAEPTERIAMLLGMQQQPAVDLEPLIREERDSARWYWLVGGAVEATGPTPVGRLRRWSKTGVEGLDFVVKAMEHRGLRIPQRRWKRLTRHEEATVRSLAVKRLTSVGGHDVAQGLAEESDASVRMAWANHAFALEEEPTSLRSTLEEVQAWEGMALDATSTWARQWLVDELMETTSPAWLIRRMSDDPPPELWSRCAALLDAPRVTSLDALDERSAQSACAHAWRVRTGRDELNYEAAVEMSRADAP